MLRQVLFLGFIFTGLFAGAQESLLLSCQTSSVVGDVQLVLEEDIPYLTYSFNSVSFKTEMEAISGVETMGIEGENLIFFELLPDGQYLMNIMYAKEVEYLIEPTYLSCK